MATAAKINATAPKAAVPVQKTTVLKDAPTRPGNGLLPIFKRHSSANCHLLCSKPVSSIT